MDFYSIYQMFAVLFYYIAVCINPLHAKYAYMRMGVVKKKKNKKKMFHSWDRTRDFRIGRLVSEEVGHASCFI